MQPCSYTLEQVLPHRKPMILIDAIEGVDLEAKRLVASVVVKPEWSASHVAIEFMAQSAAALAGCADRMKNPDRPAKPGFLLGTRKLNLALDKFTVGEKYTIEAVNVFGDDIAGSFECRILDREGRQVADATLNAYRPENIEDFKKGLQS